MDFDENEFTDENTIIELDQVDEEDYDALEDTESITEVTEEEIVVDLKKEKEKRKEKAKTKPKDEEPFSEGNPKKNKKGKKTKKPFFWKRLSKKGKIIFLIGAGVLVLIIAGLLLYFLVFRKDKTEIKEENVVIKEDNFIYENGKLKLLDEDGKQIGIYNCVDKNEKKCYVANLNNEDNFDLPKYLDESGKQLEKRSKIYNKKYVFIFDEGKISLLDINKKSKTGNYELIKTGSIDKNIVVAKNKKGKYGVIEFKNNKAKKLINFDYEYLGIFNSEETFVAKEGKSSYLINKDGDKISKETTGEIKSFSSKYIAVYNESYELYNYEGEKALAGKFDFIDFINDYIFVANGIKLYAYDNTLYKLNEAPIKLKSSEYVKTYVFDKENNLKETKKAYSITFTEDAITVEINETTSKKINLYEAAVNKNHNFVNYYDGILYFYSDENKTDLLGSYTCINKNTVSSAGDEYHNCFIATDSKIINDTNGYIPIINGNFVFIKDTKEGSSTNTIVLYDISNSKNKVKYQEVDTGLGNGEISHISSVNGIIYAKNTAGYYGAITFGNNGPSGLISFKENDAGTSKISLMGENLLVKRGGTNYLYDKLGKKLATSTFDIVKYKDGYVIVKNGSKYLLYSMPNGNSGSIISDELDYIELYDRFFVGIKNKKLNVYYITNGKDPLLTDDIDLKGNSSNDFKLTEYSNGYTISSMTSSSASVDYKFNKDWSKVEDEM